jgi:deazaflavin-dependent oxidoreductase (nitroreductase family)
MPVEVTPRGTYGARMPSMPPLVMKIGMSVGSALFRLRGLPVVTLTTTGARTGQRRTTDLLAVRDGPDAWIIAASSGGSAQHPGWFFNMARWPDQIWLRDGKRQTRVEAATLRGEEASSGYARLIALNKIYASYPTKTDRDIPVIRLTAVQ